MLEKIFKKIIILLKKHYKKILILNGILFTIFIGNLAYKIITHKPIFKTDVSLSGGVLIEIPYKFNVSNPNILISDLESKYPGSYRVITDFVTQKPIYLQIELENISDNYTDNLITYIDKKYNVNFTKKDLQIQKFDTYFSKEVYKQYILALISVLIIISLIIYLRFKNKISAFSVLSALLFDLLGVLFILSIVQFKISTIAFVAFLMIIGYAIDNNILLATNLLKEKDKPIEDIIAYSLKTGFLMDLTTFLVLVLMYLFINSDIIRELSFILISALILDMYYLICGNPVIYIYFYNKKENKSGEDKLEKN